MHGKQVHILLVEDEVAHAELIRRAFEAQTDRIDLEVAHSLDQARASLAAASPDLIIADLRLPDGDGVDLLPADQGASPYPVVIMTSHGDEQVAVEAIKAGALDYVVKTEATLAEMPRIAERIISTLLEMNRAKEPTVQAVDLAEAVEQAFDRIERTGEVRLRCTLGADPFIVHADPEQFQQVLVNLLTNVVPALDGAGQIDVTATSETHFDIVTIRDNGPGIPASMREEIFEPLFTTKAKGTGLGLAVCRHLIERHGGRLDLTDADASGTAFHIQIPRRGVDKTQIHG